MIQIEYLKKCIESKSNVGTFYIFLYSDNTFTPIQYYREIAKILNKTIIRVDRIEELSRNNFFGIDNDILSVIFLEEFKVKNYNSYDNSIIICNKIDKNTRSLYEDYIVEFPKLEKWQIKDYVYTNCEGIDQKQLDWLISTYKYDIYRLDREISKVNIFDKRIRQTIYNYLYTDDQFSDSSDKTIFDFTDAIIKKDWNKLSDIYRQIECCDIEPLGVVTILLKNFRNIINIQMGKNPTAESCGLSGKQFYVIKTYNCGIYNREQLVKIYRMLLNIDKYLKTGYLSNDKIIDYIITYISGVL